MTDITQQESARKAPAMSQADIDGPSSEIGDFETNIETSKEHGFGPYDPRALRHFDARLSRIEGALQQLVTAHAAHAAQQPQPQLAGQPQPVAGQPQKAGNGAGGNEPAAADASKPPKPSPPANSTADYVLASAYTAGLMWANPDLRRGALQFLPLAPAVLSLVDDGLNKESGKRAVIPALVGIGSVLAIGSVLK
jgi:hypothetical protein